MEKIKRCPFCGGKPEMYEDLHDLGDWQIMCKCGASCGGIVYTKKDAIKAWNKRYEDK